MDRDARELAVFAFGKLNEQLSPVYLQARQDFLNRLAMSDVTLDTMQGRIEGGTHNREVISSFCNALPGVQLEDDGRQAKVLISGPDIDEVALQQSSMVWVRLSSGPDEYPKVKLPFYVVGVDAHENRILLAPPVLRPLSDQPSDIGKQATQAMDQVKSSLLIVELKKGQRKAQKILSQVQKHVDVMNKLYMSEAHTYADAVFDRSSGLYVADADSSESLRLFKDSTFLGQIYDYGREKRVAYLPDAELRAFNVMDYLSRLAMAFGLGKEFLAALDEKMRH